MKWLSVGVLFALIVVGLASRTEGSERPLPSPPTYAIPAWPGNPDNNGFSLIGYGIYQALTNGLGTHFAWVHFPGGPPGWLWVTPLENGKAEIKFRDRDGTERKYFYP